MSSLTIKNIAITAASGAVGSVLLQKLASTGLFNILVLSSKGSKATFPAGTNVVHVDYNSVEELTAALKGQDAVVSAAGNAGAPGQIAVIDAAIAAGVKRFIPSEFGSDLDNTKTRQLPVFAFKVKTQEYLKAKVAELGSDKFSYTFIYTGAFLDWGLRANFLLDLSNNKPTFFSGGDLPFATTTLDAVADAVVGVLKNPGETANRSVYVSQAVVTQRHLYDLAKQVAPERKWEEPESLNIDEVVGKAEKELASGAQPGHGNLMPFLFKAIFYADHHDNKWGNDNELLGVKKIGDEEIKDVIKKVLEGAQ